MKKYRNYLFCIFIIAFIVTSELIGILTLFLPVPIKRRNTDETDLKMGELPYNPAYGNFTYVDNVTQLEYFFNAKEECYILAEVNGTDFTSFKLDNEVCNISYGLNIYPAYFGANFTAHNITVEQSDLDNGTIKWLAVEPLLLKEDNIVVNLSEFYVDTFSAAGPVSLLIQPNFSYNWLYVEVDSMILNNIYNTSDYPEIDSTFLSYFKEEGPYLRFDLNLLPHAHTLKLKGDGFIDYKIVVNYDWDFDGISDVEEIQKELIYTQLDPTIPNIWGFYEKTPDFYSVFNKTGKASGFFRLYIPSTYNGPQYLNIYAETGEISAIAVDDDDLTLRNVTLSKTNQKTPYGVLDSGFHLVYFEFIANKSCKMTFYVDFHEVLVLEKHEFTDSDADGVGDQIERQSGMDAFDTDTDNDGLPDNLDPSPLASLTVEGKNLHQVVFPTNSSKNTIIELIIKKPDPDYTTQTRRLWTPILDIHNGTEIIIQPVLRLFGNQSLTRDDVVIKWKEDYWHYDNFSLVDGYDSESVGDAIPNVRNPNDEYMFIHPKPTNGSYQFSINFPMGHLAKTDGVIDLRFDLLWLVLYYNETRDLNIFHFYPFENDTVIQSMMMKEIGNVSYTIGAPDSMVENEILWALTQNPQLGTPTEFGVADDIVGQGNVDYYDLINHTLSDRLDNPIEVNDTEVLYIAALQSNNDLLNKINISALTTVPFERNHTGDFELYFSFFSISNVYPEGEFNFWDEELKGKAKTCYVIGWHNYTEDQIEAYEKRANLMGFPIDMDLIYFQSSKVLRITQALGVEIPLAEIPNSRNSTLHDKIMLSDQTYIEPSQQVIGIPTLNFNEELHIYKQVFDNRQTNVETSKLVFMDYGYPFSKVFDESYNAFKNTFTDLDNFLNQHFTYSTKIDYSKIWETTLLPTEKIQLIHSFKDYVQDLPDLVLDKEFSGIDFVSFLTFNKKRNSFMGDFLGLSNPILSHFYEFGTEFYSKIKTIKYKTAFNEKVKEARYKSIFKTESRLKRISGAVVGLAKLGWRIYNFVEDLMNFHGSVVSAKELFDNNSIGALEYAGRITLTVGSLVLDGMLVAYGVILLIVKFSEFLMGKVVSFIGKFLGTAIALIGIFLVVVETLFIDIPQLSKLDISSPFLEHELTKLMVSLSFGYMIPLILMATGYSGWGILVGLVVAFIIIPILDYIFWLNQLNSQDIPSLMPNITLSEDPAETYINFDSADLLRSGGLEVGHYTELYYLFNNTGNATISLDLELGYVGGDGNFIWREYDNGNILFPGDTYQNDLSFDLGHPLIGLTLALNVTTEFHDWSVWKPLFNATTLIPLDIPVLQNNIADFYNTTVELPDLDYEGFKATFDDDIENYQYKDASDKLGILTQRVTYDFLEDPPGTFPDEWIFNCTPFCFPH
ncbi:MAG: thrombospondin type 3 repeat-containing protein, partial [Candidatus Helarchaeota archaeon]|nr:thrombospondin type 3 repeat-containing protein [Candidatus Helarchaeota archaeon]